MACANCPRQMIGCTAFHKLPHFAMWKMVKSLISLTCKQLGRSYTLSTTGNINQELANHKTDTLSMTNQTLSSRSCTYSQYLGVLPPPPPSTPLSQLQADHVILMQFANHWLPPLDTESLEFNQQWVKMVIIMWLVPPHPNPFFLEEVMKT